MRWRGREQSKNVDDRRGVGGPAVVGGGIGLIIMAIIYGLLGGNAQQFMEKQKQQQQQVATRGATTGELSPAEKERGDFAKVILKDTEDVWTELFRTQLNREYQKPRMQLFSGTTRSACGGASAESGPFYCPADETIYLDTTFFLQLSGKLGAPGDFAQAYVIAHEVAHHVQKQLGYTDIVERVRRTRSKAVANEASVRLELQADFLAGCMLHHLQKKKQVLEEGDVEEGLRAAAAIGDDRLSGGRAPKESFTHGTSEQRLRWFMKGLQTGDLAQGETFKLDASDL